MSFAFREHLGMDAPLSPTRLAGLANISVSYASEILNGRRRPSRPLAITIFAKTGKKVGPLAALSDADAQTLLRIEGAAPKRPRRPQEAA